MSELSTSEHLQELQSQLQQCDDMKGRASIRSAIQDLREKEELLNPGSVLRRSRRRTVRRPDKMECDVDVDMSETVNTLDDPAIEGNFLSYKTGDQINENIKSKHHLNSDCITDITNEGRCDVIAGNVQRGEATASTLFSIDKEGHKSEPFRSKSNESENRPPTSNTLPVDAGKSERKQQFLSPDAVTESSGRRSRSPFTKFLKTKPSENSAKEYGPKSPTSPTQVKEPGLGKRRFSKRFRKRNKSSSSFDAAEAAQKSNSAPDNSKQASSSLIQPQSSSTFSSVSSPSVNPLRVPGSPPAQLNTKPTLSTNSQTSKKHSARVVLHAISKRFFTAKQKFNTTGEPPSKKPISPDPTPTTSKPYPWSSIEPHETTTTAVPSLTNLESKLEQGSLEQTTNRPTESRSRASFHSPIMAEVLSRPHGVAHAQNKKYLKDRPDGDDKEESSAVEYQPATVGELQVMLDKGADCQEKLKTKSVITTLQKNNNNNADQGSLSPVVTVESSGSGASLKRNAPHVGNGSPILSNNRPSFNVTFNNNTLTKGTNSPWAPDPAKRLSFGPVPSVNPKSKPSNGDIRSAPSSVQKVNVSFNSQDLSESSPFKRTTTPNSRFGRREFSASFKTYKPSYKVPEHVVSRSESLKFHRPKDFIKENTSESKESSLFAPPRPFHSSLPGVKASVFQVSPTNTQKEPIVSNPFQATEQQQTPKSNFIVGQPESCKEDQSSSADPSLPFIPVVRGNKRRSRNIIDRVLSFKIDSEKRYSPKAENTNRSTPSTPQQPTETSSVVVSPVKNDLLSISEQQIVPIFKEETTQSQYPSSVVSNGVVEVTVSFDPATSTEQNFTPKSPFASQPDPIRQDTHVTTKDEQVSCDSEPVAKQPEKESIQADSPDEALEKCKSLLEELSSAASESCNYTEVRDLLVSLIDKIVKQREEEEKELQSLCNSSFASSLEEDIKSEPSSSSEEEEKYPSVDLKTELTSEEETDLHLPAKDNQEEESSSSNQAADHQQATLASGDQDLTASTEEHIHSSSPSKSPVTLSSTASTSICKPFETVVENPYSVQVEKVLSSSPLSPESTQICAQVLEDVVKSVTLVYSPKEEEENFIWDTHSTASESVSDISNDRPDFEDDNRMSSRYTGKNRYGDDGGSVKSRILATEDSSKHSSGDTSKLLKKSRQSADARAFRNAEGVKSRLNKFLNADTPPTSNGSPRISKKNVENSSKIESRATTNGEINPRRERRKKHDDVNNNDVTKSPKISSSKYAKDRKTTEKPTANLKENETNKVQTIPESSESVVDSRAPKVDIVGNGTDLIQGAEEQTCKDGVDGSSVVADKKKEDSSCEDEITIQVETDISPSLDSPSHKISEIASAMHDSSTEQPAYDVTCERVPSPTPAASSTDMVSAFAKSPSADVIEDSPAPNVMSKEKVTAEINTNEPVSSSMLVSESAEWKKSKNSLHLEKLKDESSTEPTPRRRRRVRGSQDPSRSSTGSSTVSTPDQELSSVSRGSESSSNDVASSTGTPDTDAVISFSIAPQTRDSITAKDNEIPSIPENVEPDHVTSRVEPTKFEEAVTTNNEENTATAKKENLKGNSSDGSTIKLKRVRSAPDQSIVTLREAKRTEIEESTIKESTAQITDKLEIVITGTKNTEVLEITETKKTEVLEITETDMAPQTATEVQYTLDNLEQCKEESVLQKMLDEAVDYEDRKRIRGAIRVLRKTKAAAGNVTKPKQSTNTRWQRNTASTEVSVKKDKNSPSVTMRTTVTSKNEYKEVKTPSQSWRNKTESPLVGAKETKSPPDPKSLAEKYSLTSTSKKEMSGGPKKIGSIFDREEESPRKTGSRADFERRQAERRREVTRNKTMPSGSAKDARKLFVAKLEGENGAKPTGAKKVGRSPTFVVPNANNVKQMLLKWCQAKTRGYEHVDINNFSGSWASGMAFCALVHNFFPDAFDYAELDPKNRAHNFELAFNMAEIRGDIPPLLDPEDMIRMAEPDWKCVYTYITEFYKRIRELGM